MTESKMFRMRLSSYRRLRREFSAQRGESAASYFERLSKFLEQRGSRWGFK